MDTATTYRTSFFNEYITGLRPPLEAAYPVSTTHFFSINSFRIFVVNGMLLSAFRLNSAQDNTLAKYNSFTICLLYLSFFSILINYDTFCIQVKFLKKYKCF